MTIGGKDPKLEMFIGVDFVGYSRILGLLHG
jgi:hypothetical protein